MEDDTITGTDGDDDLRGTSGGEVIRGLGGDDALRGRGGDDRLEGGTGDDTLRGGSGDDVLEGGAGDDTIIGGGGFDVVSYADVGIGGSPETIGVRGVEVDFGDADADGFATASVDRSEDGIDGDERDRILVSAAGGRGVEGFEGSGYDDTFTGSDRDEVVFDSLGQDDLDGGGGDDTISYRSSQFTQITVGPSGGLSVLKDSVFLVDSISGFETVVAAGDSGSSFGGNSFGVINLFDVLEPSPLPVDIDLGAETVTIRRGSIGEDDITIRIVGLEDFDGVAGSVGDDTIVGGAKDDDFFGTRGDDTYVGRGGDDTLSYFSSFREESDDTASSILGLGVNTLLDEGEVVGRDTFAVFDVEAGTVELLEGVFADDLRLAENTIDASRGAPGPVSVRIDLEDGRVDATFAGDVGGFSGGDRFGFDVWGFANLVGTKLDDILLGDDGSNRIEGGRGEDRIRGGDGRDRLIGQNGDDDIRGEDGNDRLDGGRGDDELRGGSGDDRVFGQRGDDLITGGLGADALGGGTGADTFRWTSGQIGADAGRNVDIVIDFQTDDFALIAGERFSAREAFDLAREEAVVEGVEFGVNIFGNQIVLRADGEDQGEGIDSSEVFARLRIEPDDFALA